MMTSMISSLYAYLVALMSIICHYYLLFLLQVKALNSVAMSVNMVIIKYFFCISFRSFFIMVAASNPLANPNVSALRINITTLRELIPA